MSISNNNKTKGIEELMLVILNCALLHNQNDGWTVPYPYLTFCCTNINLRMLFKETRVLDKNYNYMILEHFT